MFHKLLILVLVVCVVCGVLLGLRHRRLHLMHQMTQLHDQMDEDRKDIWQSQVAVSRHLGPAELRQAIAQAGLELTPVAPGHQARTDAAPDAVRIAEVRHDD